MSDSTKLTPEERQNLVAYLDGELDEEDARTLDAKLSRDTESRNEAETLGKVWDMLDYLPRPQAPTNFTHKTLDRLETQQLKLARRARRKRWPTRVSWAAGILAAAVMSYVAASALVEPPPAAPIHRAQPTAPPLPEEANHYLRVRSPDGRDLEFLEQLQAPAMFGDLAAELAPPMGARDVTPLLLDVTGVAADLAGPACGFATPAGLARVPASMRPFLTLPSDLPDRIRRLDQFIHEHEPDAAVRLTHVVQVYGEWLDRLERQASADYRKIQDARTLLDKVERIREVRDSQWIATLPAADRDRIRAAQAEPSKRQRIIDDLRQKELEWARAWETNRREQDWQAFIAKRAGEFEEITKWYDGELKNKLTQPERKQIQDLRGKGRGYMLALVDFAEKKNVPLPAALQKVRYPLVTDQKLLGFLKREVSPSERERHEKRFMDPEQKDEARLELSRLYWEAHPEELKKLRGLDRPNRPKPGPPTMPPKP